MANYKRASERYNDRMAKLMAGCRELERERLERGEMPNPSLTSPDEAREYGWAIVGREVHKIHEIQPNTMAAHLFPGKTHFNVR